MFRSIENRGFQIKFSNGYKISVQFGPMNYCEKRSFSCKTEDSRAPLRPGNEHWESPNAEIAIFDPSENFLPIGNGDDVVGWVSPDKVGNIIGYVSSVKVPDPNFIRDFLNR